MRSLFAKILIWFLLTLAACLAGLNFTYSFRNRFTPARHDFFSRTLSFQTIEAENAYETGGKAALAAYFARLDSYYPGTHSLVDQNGIDVLSGKNRKAELRHIAPLWSPGTQSRMLTAWPSRDGKYRMVIDSLHPPGPPSPIPFYLWMVAATVVFCYILAVHLASPLRALEQVVVRFGRGDLASRADTKRGDEIGKLSRAFNVMADRIENLLTAERRLLQDVSHELRSPLARLKFAVELARTHPDREASFSRIDKELNLLSKLVSELLQVTRAEGDPRSREREELSLLDLLMDVINDNEMEASANGRTLLITKREEVWLLGDRELLRRAVENVLRNAVRFSPPGSYIEVGLERRRSIAEITIRDFGPGVPDENLENLFKPFYRVEADRSRDSGGGVGLGLAIAERAISIHDGTIRAINARPGLRVEITLPDAFGRSTRAGDRTQIPLFDSSSRTV
jgi:two-component system sensor histidine kinase CpxA